MPNNNKGIPPIISPPPLLKSNWAASTNNIGTPTVSKKDGRGTPLSSNHIVNRADPQGVYRILPKGFTSTIESTVDKKRPLPRGIINANPLNIRQSNDVYDGEITGDDTVFKTFSNLTYGYRAGIVTLGTYIEKGHNTIFKIINRWAPPSENKTKEYINSVVKSTGVDKNKVITNRDGDIIKKIIAAQAIMESGHTVDPVKLDAAFNLQTKITSK